MQDKQNEDEPTQSHDSRIDNAEDEVVIIKFLPRTRPVDPEEIKQFGNYMKYYDFPHVA